MRLRGRAKGARASLRAAALAFVGLRMGAGAGGFPSGAADPPEADVAASSTSGAADPDASDAAASADAAALSGTLAFGKTGLVRLVVDQPRLQGADPRLRLMLVNEGTEDFRTSKLDAWIVVMRDGRTIPFAPRTDMVALDVKDKRKGEDEPFRRAVVEPWETLRLMLAPPTPMEGEVASVELRCHDLEQSLLAAGPYRRARRRLVAPIVVPADFKAASDWVNASFRVAVGPEGKVQSVTPIPSEGSGNLRKGFAALARTTIAAWTFDPALSGGRPEPSLVKIDVPYTSHRVLRRVFAIPETTLSSNIAAYLRATFPFFVEIPEAHGFAVAGPLPEGEKGTIHARAWFLRTGQDEGGAWVVAASRTLTAHDPETGIGCGCDLIWDREDASLRLMEAITERIGLTASSSATLIPVDTVIPSGLPETLEKGVWRVDAVSGLLRAALARADQIRKSARTKDEKDGEMGKPVPDANLPRAEEFPYRGEDIVIRAGDATSEGVTPPKLLSKTVPDYPEIARRERIEGNVFLRARIDETGTVRGVEALRGPPALFFSSLDAVACWKYAPALLRGKPVPVDYVVVVTYSLR